jgi:hypothetical protein
MHPINTQIIFLAVIVVAVISCFWLSQTQMSSVVLSLTYCRQKFHHSFVAIIETKIISFLWVIIDTLVISCLWLLLIQMSSAVCIYYWYKCHQLLVVIIETNVISWFVVLIETKRNQLFCRYHRHNCFVPIIITERRINISKAYINCNSLLSCQ